MPQLEKIKKKRINKARKEITSDVSYLLYAVPRCNIQLVPQSAAFVYCLLFIFVTDQITIAIYQRNLKT